MRLEEMYETNEDFRGYVDRYAKTQGISTNEALSHAIVQIYAEYIEERKKADGK